MHQGFEPVYDSQSRILILGSFPSVKSREVGFYYGNKQNRFWKMLSQIFNEKISDDIEEKKAFLSRHKIALWDVIISSDLSGSADISLEKSQKVISDFDHIFANSKIEKVLCNGKTAYSLFVENHKTSLPVICMPSTSSANPRFSVDSWEKELEILK
jgi:hypoxanthine-DNA glycosylase